MKSTLKLKIQWFNTGYLTYEKIKEVIKLIRMGEKFIK